MEYLQLIVTMFFITTVVGFVCYQLGAQSEHTKLWRLQRRYEKAFEALDEGDRKKALLALVSNDD